MPRTLIPVPEVRAQRLSAYVYTEDVMLKQAAAARAQLARALALEYANGYSVRALAAASGLSVGRVRILLNEAAT